MSMTFVSGAWCYGRIMRAYLGVAAVLACGACNDDYAMRVDACAVTVCDTPSAIGKGGAISLLVDDGDQLATEHEVVIESTDPEVLTVRADAGEWLATGVAPGTATLVLRSGDGAVADTLDLAVADPDGITVAPLGGTPATGSGRFWYAPSREVLTFRATPMIAGRPSFGLHTYRVLVDGATEYAIGTPQVAVGSTFTRDVLFDVTPGPHAISLVPRLGAAFTFDVAGE
jgi:hypothetical protein